MVLAREQPSACEMVKKRICVAPGNEHSFLLLPMLVLPNHGDTMGRVFAAESEEAGKVSGPDLLQPNQTNASNRRTGVQLGPKPRRQLALDDLRVHSKVDQHPSANHALNLW